ncbi:MAG: hypothetical protein P4N24_21440 [Acidobacteriota bacterium]|nr:hypothetical protein [Acidobacteriota bacterium]
MKPGPSSTRKRVVVRKLDKGLIKGFLDVAGHLASELEVLDREGRVVHVLMSEVKGIFFVRDFEGNPDRAERKIFRSRPRLAGLWVRMTFKDSEVLEALLANNLLDVDPLGYLVTPPDVYSNNLRIFIPRSALTEMEVLGVISDGVVRRMSQRAAQARAAGTAEQQFGLFTATSPLEKK